MAATALPTLTYFQFRGRAFASRVALFNALGKNGWTDARVSLPRFKQYKQRAQMLETPSDRISAEYITDNLPQLNLPCGLKVSQSHAIARYAGQLAPPARALPEHFVRDLYPRDAQQALLVDEAVAVVDQILLLTPKDEDGDTRSKNREAYHTSGFLRVAMELLEGRLEASGGPFLLGHDISIADLYIRAPLGDLFDLGQFDGIPRSFYDSFARVKQCAEAVPEHALLKAYHEQYKS
jgi:glutathione S-transferase